jgi:ankyrin repeat protein
VCPSGVSHQPLPSRRLLHSYQPSDWSRPLSAQRCDLQKYHPRDNCRVTQYRAKRGSHSCRAGQRQPRYSALQGDRLISAAAAGRLRPVEELLEAGAPPNHREGLAGHTALHKAALKGSALVAQVLLEATAAVDCRSAAGETPLHLACKEGHTQVVATLLQAGARTEAADAKGATALFRAAEHGHADAARLLVVTGGASIEHATPDRGTPLDAACSAPCTPGRVAAAVVLVELGAVAAPRHLAFACRHGREGLARLLLRADVPAGAPSGDELLTPLHFAALHNHAPVVTLLLQSGAKMEAVGREGTTALDAACTGGCAAAAAVLLDWGAEARGAQLRAACERGHVAIAQLLLRHRVPPDAPSKEGAQETPLHIAAGAGSDAIVRLLLAGGAAVDPPSRAGDTPLGLACARGHTVVAARLLGSGAAPAPAHLLAACEGGHVPAAKLLLERGVPAGCAAATTLLTPLHLAAQRGSKELARLLLQHGAPVGAAAADGATALHLAVLAYHDARGSGLVAGLMKLLGSRARAELETVDLLVAAGAPLAAENKAGKTPAQLTESATIRQALLKGGAK